MSNKIIVKTSGSFMLLDPYTGTEIEPLEETEVDHTNFIRERLELGQLVLVEEAAPAKPAAKPHGKATKAAAE